MSKIVGIVLALVMVVTTIVALPILVMGTMASAAELCDPNNSGAGQWSAPSSAAKGIPSVAYEAYVKAGQKYGIDWAYLAAVGEQESNHGRAYGNKLDAKGVARPGIFGPPTPYGKAMGPMQFIPSTWASSGKDGNGDGRKDPQNIWDAAFAAASYLRNSGAPANWQKALFAYNHAQWYVDQVTAKAQKYRATAGNTSSGGMSLVAARTPATSTSSRVWPVGKNANIGARFGQPGRMWSSGYHTGVDFSAPSGKPIYAAHSGEVRTVSGGPYGNHTFIKERSANGVITETLYAHQSSFVVKRGRVQAGQKIGKVGSTGNSTGPHLHFEVLINGKRSDPIPWLQGAADSPTGDRTVSSVFVVGDSLTVGTKPYLRQAFGSTDLEVDAANGRTMAQGLQVLKRSKEANAAGAWVVALGTNDGNSKTFGKQIEQVIEMAQQRQVVMLTIKGTRAAASLNHVMKGVADDVRSLSAVEFDPTASLMAADGIHMTPAGYKWRAELYASSITSADVAATCSDDTAESGGDDLGPAEPGPYKDSPEKLNTRGVKRTPPQAVKWLLDVVNAGKYYPNLCLKLADDAYAAYGGRQGRAIDQWYKAKAAGKAHPKSKIIPIGAQVFWWSNNDARHVATYIGGGRAVSNVSASGGKVEIKTMKYFESYGPYLGWAEPYYP